MACIKIIVYAVWKSPVSEHCWSAVGSMAKHFHPSAPTMVLNFSGLDSHMIKSTIIHQFGHALGLGHALMRPKDWATIRKHVNTEEMKMYGITSKEDFKIKLTGKGLKELEWTETGLKDDSAVNYDETSVMQYR